ncbi:hypothetical protein S245_038536, partial [Arachis hypogaea]
SSPPSRNTAPPRSFESPVPPVMSSDSMMVPFFFAPPLRHPLETQEAPVMKVAKWNGKFNKTDLDPNKY